MKKYSIITILCLAVLTSCDDRKDQLQILNQPPVIDFTKNDVRVKELTDSLRLIPGSTSPYNIFLNVYDENQNIQFLNWRVTKGDYKLYFQNKEVFNPSSFRTEYSNLILNFYPTSIGNYSAEFKATDRFGKDGIGKMNLFVFENLLPVAKLAAEKTSSTIDGEYLIDGSGSFDEDKNFKGGITYYEFTVDGVIIKQKGSKLNHVFEKGDHSISLKVYDNSGGVSETVALLITIS